MKRYPDHLIKQARRLVVSSGSTYAMVAKELGVHSSYVSMWCRGLKNFKLRKMVERNEKRRNEILNSEVGVAGELSLDSPEMSKLCCAILYGCEGSKYPASSSVSFTNSDPGLMRAFLCLFRRAFALDEARFRGSLQVHNDQNYRELLGYWSEVLGIPSSSFYRPTITTPRGLKHRNF